jgi:poly-gamma-glutamate synthesis protein (capsule biosynthesis protein)
MSGVTALTRDTRTALDNNGIEWATEAILPDVSHADFFHTSNEVSIYPTCPQTDGPLYGGALSFCSKPEHFDLLDLIGVDIVELTGNHNNDYGYEAYLRTLSWYRDHGITTVGGGETIEDARRPVFINHHGNSIAIVACNWIGPYYALANEDPLATGGVRPGAAFCDEEWLRNTLPVLSAENDLLVVSVQYLEHDQYTPTAQQQNDFRLLANLGADVVVGTQAHFPQTIEFYPRASDTEAFIHYGLGNLFFDQIFFAGRRFLMDQLFIYDGQLLNVDLFTGIIDDQARPRPMTPDERENFLYLMMIEYGGY